jgi:hypothetical protein
MPWNARWRPLPGERDRHAACRLRWPISERVVEARQAQGVTVIVPTMPM